MFPVNRTTLYIYWIFAASVLYFYVFTFFSPFTFITYFFFQKQGGNFSRLLNIFIYLLIFQEHPLVFTAQLRI